MRQGHDDRALAEALADPVLEWARTKKALDRHLADRDQDLRREQSQLGVEPVRAVRDAGGRRPQVGGVGLGAAPGMRPRLVIGLPPISLMSAVKAIGGAELIAIPTP